MIAFPKTLPLLAWIALTTTFTGTAANAQDGFLIRVTAEGRAEVVPYKASDATSDKQTGIAVWNQEQGERWAVLPNKPGTSSERTPAALAAALKASTRGGSTVGVPAGPGCTTFQPDQLLGLVVTRAVGSNFLAPENKGRHLDGRITIRRVKGEERLPAIEAQIFRGSQPIVKVKFAEGQDTLRWSEVPELPPMFKDGLPPGLYSLRVGQGQITSFQVEDDEVREKVEQPLVKLEEFTSEGDPLRLVARVQLLLDQDDEDGEPRSYTCDVLDDVDAALVKETTPWLTELRERLVRRLLDEESQPNDANETGLAQIDKARASLQAGNWSAALEALDEIDANTTPRERALALLYRAVIAAESGATSGTLPDEMFRDAIGQLQGGDPADLYRAHNNYGGVLFARARDRVHNHAFQMASGVTAPLSTALADWSGALEQYQLALAQAEKLPPQLAAGVKVNLAQLYALLADMIRVLDYAPDGQREFAAGEDAATATAREFASSAAALKTDALDPITRGSAHEVLAQLAYRADDAETSRSEAMLARSAYLEAGSIAGVESVERLVGLLSARTTGGDLPPAQADDALRHLQLAHQLTEMLRLRIPADRAGLSRAGFFARRAYVNERIVELLVAKGEAAEALAYAEAAKARALQDLLAQRGVTEAKSESRNLAVVLESWPSDVAAVEYFLGAERGWVFLVDHVGKVHAQAIVDQEGKPIASRELVARVQQLLSGMESQATKMFRAASSGGSFDHSWQNQLHDFFRELLPSNVSNELRSAKTVVIVPHHVLHYFPFAALVTEVDSQARGKFEQPQPKFLIDEGFAICRAPSIVAWDLLRGRPDKFAQVQAVGIVEFAEAAPLPGVEQDMANLKQVFGVSVKNVVEAANASEFNVKQVLQQPGMLFIATHGRNIPQQPLASYLLCHGDDKNDGYLTAGELFGSEIASQMIVMSACYSGLADQSPLPGDDLFGIERSLLNAGAGTIVSGLWDVYDATGPLLMNAFFTHLVQGQTAATALANSQRDFLRDRRKEGPSDPWIHPYFWSVYTLSGSDKASVEK